MPKHARSVAGLLGLALAFAQKLGGRFGHGVHPRAFETQQPRRHSRYDVEAPPRLRLGSGLGLGLGLERELGLGLGLGPGLGRGRGLGSYGLGSSLRSKSNLVRPLPHVRRLCDALLDQVTHDTIHL